MSVASPTHRHPLSSEQQDVKTIFFAVFLLILTCVQGIRISDVPVPFALFFSIFYLFVFRPPIPAAAPSIYAIIISYLLVVSTRNALSTTGGVRDFLYIGLCFTSLTITIALFDIFRTLDAKTIAFALSAVALFEVSIQLVEYFNVGSINSIMAPLLRFWAAQTNSQDFLVPEELATRTPGTFGTPTSAGLVLYLVIRGAAIVLRRRGLIYLSIVPIIIGGARTALIVFLLWEVFANALLYWRRNVALTMTGVLFFFAGIVTLLAFPDLITRVFIFRAFDVTPTQFAAGFSVVNRVRSIEWALQNWREFVTFGGITSADLASRMAWQGAAVDSELILRSMQFGFAGFLCLLAANVWTGFYWKNYDSWFMLIFAMVTSFTNAMLSSFVLFPFVIIYSLCVYVSQVESPRAGEATDSPKGSHFT